MLDQITRENFTAQVNTNFRVGAGTEPAIELELVSVRDLGSSAGHDQFSLEFRGPQQPLLPQSIYPLQHERLGAFDLFLVPIAREPEGLRYEAIINRVNR